MITITKDNKCPDFGHLIGDPFDTINPPQVSLSTIGQIIKSQIANLNDNPDFLIYKYIIMPDHIHILWRVQQALQRELGYYIGLFKSYCTKIIHEQKIFLGSVFTPKYNDRIVYSDDIYLRFCNYISDNPRRRLIVIKYPHLFSRKQSVNINGQTMDVYGNFQLLKHPIISPVIVSSKYTEEQRVQLEKDWSETIQAGGVLISPFISQAEREIMRIGIAGGASIIRIIPEGLPPKYKPSGSEFELCLTGRCLHIGFPKQSKRNERLSRSTALSLNDLARWIASHPTERMTLLNAAHHL
jgi:REP element-mobilizing transposase RayT